MRFPNPLTFIKALWRARKAVLVDESTLKFRLDQCRACEKHDPRLDQCQICSCFVILKAQLSTEDCPIGRWKRSKLTKR